MTQADMLTHFKNLVHVIENIVRTHQHWNNGMTHEQAIGMVSGIHQALNDAENTVNYAENTVADVVQVEDDVKGK